MVMRMVWAVAYIVWSRRAARVQTAVSGGPRAAPAREEQSAGSLRTSTTGRQSGSSGSAWSDGSPMWSAIGLPGSSQGFLRSET